MESRHPYGMNPTEQCIEEVVKTVQKIHKECPETTCKSRAECCKFQSPNMYYNEFLNLRRNYVEKMSKEERLELTIACIRLYLYDESVSKPCVFLKDHMCSAYEFRQIKCRLYGLLPEPLYKRIVNEVSKEQREKKENLPLCQQCPHVKIKPEFAKKYPNNMIPETKIRALEKRMRLLDKKLGMPKEIQEKGFGFLTYHDWHLMFELGESWMESWTKLRQKMTSEQKERMIELLKKELIKRETV